MELSTSQVRRILGVNPRTFANWVSLIEPVTPARGKGSRVGLSPRNLLELALIQLLFLNRFDGWAVEHILKFLWGSQPEVKEALDLKNTNEQYLFVIYEERPASRSGGKKGKSLSIMVRPKLGSKLDVPWFIPEEPEAMIVIDLKRLRERVANELEKI